MARTALVTGANRGLGLEFVRQLLARGDRVVAKSFTSTCKQALDPKNKVAAAEVDKLVMREVQARAVQFLRANP